MRWRGLRKVCAPLSCSVSGLSSCPRGGWVLKGICSQGLIKEVIGKTALIGGRFAERPGMGCFPQHRKDQDTFWPGLIHLTCLLPPTGHITLEYTQTVSEEVDLLSGQQQASESVIFLPF